MYHSISACPFEYSWALEIVADYQTDMYRGVYTVQFRGLIYVVLHVFQKKSKTGKAMPRRDVEFITRRLKDAEHAFRERQN